MKHCLPPFAKCSAFAVLVVCTIITPAAHAQLVGSVSGSLSDNLSSSFSDENETEGFDSTFDSESSSFINPTLHTDISDPTHSSLEGSAISPVDNSYLSASVSNTPQTSILSDAQSAVGAFSGGFGGRRSQIFTAGGGARGSSVASVSATSSFGLASMETAFSGGTSGRAAFSGTTANTAGTALSFSGEGIPVPPTVSGIGVTQMVVSSSSLRDPNRETASDAYYALDPVLSGSDAGSEGDTELLGDMAEPSSQTGQFFAEYAGPTEAQYEFDDGQTPLRSFTATPTNGLAAAPDYGPSPSGFPDSTRGLAGLPSELSNATSPLSGPANLSGSPFPDVSGGNYYGLTLRFAPSLHAQPAYKPTFNFEAVERREQEQRLLHGASISESSEIYAQDLRKYQRMRGRPLPQRPTRDLGAPNSSSQNALGTPSIR